MGDLGLPVRYLKGVGPKKGEIFNQLGVQSLLDLFYYFPRRYENRKLITGIADAAPGEQVTIQAEVLTSGQKKGFRGKRIFTVGLNDGTGTVFAVFFNQPYLQDTFKPGQQVILSGRIENYKGERQMVHPAFEIGGAHKVNLETGRIVPLYRLPEGLSQRSFHLLLWETIQTHSPDVKDIVPFDVRKELNLGEIRYALKNIHFPASDTDLKKAREYLIFEEFFVIAATLRLRRLRTGAAKEKSSRDQAEERVRTIAFPDFLTRFQELISFNLTESQQTSLREITADLQQPFPMRRLLTGEVGSGKTLVAAGAIFHTVLNGGQAALLAPTEILAEQHFLNLQRIFARAGKEAALLVSGITRPEKNAIQKGLAEGRISVVIGTHSLLSEKLIFPKLTLAVVDEEHKFGVNQRDLLGERGRDVHFLLMSATPIPRTLALTLYGEIALSNLSVRGKRQVATYLFQAEEREAAYRLFDRSLGEGKKGYVVASRLKGGEELVGAETLFQDVRRRFPHWQPALIHGKLPLAEKERVIKGFQSGEYRVLVATSVIEVGLDLPEANVLLIEDAENFGLAQLHQMRGRIGREFQEALCLVISGSQAEPAVERLELFASTPEGQELAEDDLVLRGEGEVLGERQHGLPPLRLANLRRDLSLLQSAREVAWGILDSDPDLRQHPELRQRLTIQNLI